MERRRRKQVDYSAFDTETFGLEDDDSAFVTRTESSNRRPPLITQESNSKSAANKSRNEEKAKPKKKARVFIEDDDDVEVVLEQKSEENYSSCSVASVSQSLSPLNSSQDSVVKETQSSSAEDGDAELIKVAEADTVDCSKNGNYTPKMSPGVKNRKRVQDAVETATTTTPASVQLADSKKPRWSAPRKADGSTGGTTPLTPMLSGGRSKLRIGLSRNIRVKTPLHPSASKLGSP